MWNLAESSFRNSNTLPNISIEMIRGDIEPILLPCRDTHFSRSAYSILWIRLLFPPCHSSLKTILVWIYLAWVFAIAKISTLLWHYMTSTFIAFSGFWLCSKRCTSNYSFLIECKTVLHREVFTCTHRHKLTCHFFLTHVLLFPPLFILLELIHNMWYTL